MTLQPILQDLSDSLVGPDGIQIRARPGAALGGRGGSIRNTRTGMGGYNDKSMDSTFRFRIPESQFDLDAIYDLSWAAQRFIDMPVNDLLRHGRTFINSDPDEIERVLEFQRQLQVIKRLARAMKLGRHHGTGYLVPITQEAPLTEPLVVENIGRGDLLAYRVFSRFKARVVSWKQDYRDPNMGEPEILEFWTRFNQRPLQVHSSRCIKFNGRTANADDGWGEPHNAPWGLSVLSSAMADITRTESVMQATAHLIQESSMVIVNTASYPEALQNANADPNRIMAANEKIQEQAELFNQLKSIFRIAIVAPDDKVSRLDMRIAGWADLLNAYAQYLAAITGIPESRFLGRTSSAGMSNTGQGDQINYGDDIAAQQLEIESELSLIDQLNARTLGLAKPLPYIWNPFTSATPEDQAKVSRQRTETLTKAQEAGDLTADEVRFRLSGDPLYGVLAPLTDEQRAAIKKEAEARSGGNQQGQGSPRRANETSEPVV